MGKISQDLPHLDLEKNVDPAGLEPATIRLRVECSTD